MKANLLVCSALCCLLWSCSEDPVRSGEEPFTHVLQPSSFPTNLHVTDTTQTSYVVRWTDGAGNVPAERYLAVIHEHFGGQRIIPQDSNEVPDGPYAKSVATGVQHVTFTNLTPGTLYRVAVYPYNGRGRKANYKNDEPRSAEGFTLTIRGYFPTGSNSTWYYKAADLQNTERVYIQHANPADGAIYKTLVFPERSKQIRLLRKGDTVYSRQHEKLTPFLVEGPAGTSWIFEEYIHPAHYNRNNRDIVEVLPEHTVLGVTYKDVLKVRMTYDSDYWYLAKGIGLIEEVNRKGEPKRQLIRYEVKN